MKRFFFFWDGLLSVFCKRTKRLGCNWLLIETKILNLYLLELCFVSVMLPNLSLFFMCNIFMYIYRFLATFKIKESATKANLLWRAKSEPRVRILIRFQLKTFLPYYYLLLVFRVTMAKWLAFSLPALKGFSKKKLIVFTLGAMVSSALYLIVVEVKHFSGFSNLGFFL